MNSIFPPGGGNPSQLIGMPNFYSGRPQQQMQQIPIQQEPGLQRVSRQVSQPQQQNEIQQQPLNYAYKAPESDKFATNIIMGTTEADKQKRALELANTKGAPTMRNASTNQQKADLATFKAKNPNMKFIVSKGGNVQAFNPLTGEGFDTGVDSGTLSEQDKIELTGEQTRDTEKTRQTGRMDLQNTKGNQALEQIGARISGNKDVAELKFNQTRDKALAPSQVNSEQKNAARELVSTRPDLAQYVKIESNGNFTVDPNTPLNELSMIQNAIYPKSNKDINLPSNQKTEVKPTTSTTKSTKPSAADLIKKYGG